MIRNMERKAQCWSSNKAAKAATAVVRNSIVRLPAGNWKPEIQHTDLVLNEPTSERLPDPFVLAPHSTDEDNVVAIGLHIPLPVRGAVGEFRAVGSCRRAGGRFLASSLGRKAIRVAHVVEGSLMERKQRRKKKKKEKKESSGRQRATRDSLHQRKYE